MVSEHQDIAEIAREVTYPVLVKPAVASHGARGIEFVHRPDELAPQFNEIARQFGRSSTYRSSSRRPACSTRLT